MSTRRSYSPEFRRDAVRRLRNGASSPRELAAELGCSLQTLQKWDRQLDLDPDLADGAHATLEQQATPDLPVGGASANHTPAAEGIAPELIFNDSEALADWTHDEEGPLEPASEPIPAPRSPTLLDVLTQRWWIVLAVTVLAIVSAWAYSSTVPPRYQATATVLAHPAVSVTRASDYSTDLSLLSYGSLEQTFVALARSSKLIDGATATLGLGRAESDRYHAVANVLPSSTVLEISVDGPDKEAVVPLVNMLGASVSKATRKYFPIFALTPLDAASRPSSQVEPRTRQNVLFGGLAGLVIGVGVALLSLRVAALSRIRVRGRGWTARS